MSFGTYPLSCFQFSNCSTWKQDIFLSCSRLVTAVNVYLERHINMGTCLKLQNKRKTETGEPSLRVREERGQCISVSNCLDHSKIFLKNCKRYLLPSVLSCTQLSAAIVDNLSQTKTDVRREHFPIFAKGIYVQWNMRQLLQSTRAASSEQSECLNCNILWCVWSPALPSHLFLSDIFPYLRSGFLNSQGNGQIGQALGACTPLWHCKACKCQSPQAWWHPGTGL